MTFLSNVAVWISTVMEPAGVEAGTGILSTAYVKDPDDPAWKDDAGVKGWREFMTKYVPDGDQHDTNYVNAYNSAMVLEAVLKAKLIGAIIREIDHRGLTHMEVAARSGLPRSAVTGILSGSLQKVTIDRVLRLLEAVGLKASISVRRAA